uniref:Translation initiation factor IF-3, mitochondrial n=2 Tax=Lygus hesperus TaxID=30085 RepID=A0A0A9WZW2_LYGHE
MLVSLGLKCLREAVFRNGPCKTIRSPDSSIYLFTSPVTSRWLSSQSKTEKTPEAKEAEEKKNAKRKETHIALINPDKTVTHTTLEDANKLSKRRDLKLIKISDYDRKRDSPVYQLMTAAQFREEALSLKKTKKSEDKKGPYKGEKLLALNSKIEVHDLESKIHKMVGWLEKNFEVRVTISGNKPEDGVMAEKVFKRIESIVGSQGRILQKRSSGNDVKFQVVPPKQPKTSKTVDVEADVPEGAPKTAELQS